MAPSMLETMFQNQTMILVILKEELPEERESSFWPFLSGTVLYAGLVLAEFYLAA